MSDLNKTLKQLGQLIAQSIAQGMEVQGEKRIRRATSARVASAYACRVRGCGSDAVSKSLCSKHYQKALRLQMDMDALRAIELRRLALDGRKMKAA